MDAPPLVATPSREPQRQGMVPYPNNCIHIRGLPYDATEGTIVKFLGEHALNVVDHGVHMVSDTFGQPSGEAFIWMDSEQSAFSAAIHCHGRCVKYKGKPRRIEVTQFSMELVHGPSASPGPPLLASLGVPGAPHVPVLPLAAAVPSLAALGPSSALVPTVFVPDASLPVAPQTHTVALGVVMVLLRDLPPSASVHYILELLQGFPELTPECVNVQRGADGNPNGKATVVFPRPVEAARVLEKLRRRNVGIDFFFVT